MAEHSTMLALGTELPDATLTDVRTEDKITLSEVEGEALMVVFLCNHCPYVKHLQKGLATFSQDYADSDVAIVGIASNDVDTYPDDSPAELARVADEVGYEFAILFDEDQSVARAFTAACTPDFFVFGPDRKLAYRGQFDDSRPGSDIPVTGDDMRAAVNAIAAGAPAPSNQKPSVGCSIKWKK